MSKDHTTKTYTDENPGMTQTKSQDMITDAINYLKSIDISSMNLNSIKIKLELESNSEKVETPVEQISHDMEARLKMQVAIIQNGKGKMNAQQLNTFIDIMINHLILYFGRKQSLEALVVDDIELSHETILPRTLNRAFRNLNLGFMIEYLDDGWYVKKIK